MAFEHRPVMGREVVEVFEPVPAGVVVDATVGGGGHARLLLGACPDLTLLGLDRDADAVASAREGLSGFGDRVRVVYGGFERLREIVVADGSEGKIVGILFDLGVSSPQLDRPERGFSYWAEAPLDMRMDGGQHLTAAQIVNRYDEDALARLISENGEERYARRIAAGIVAARPLETTGQLVEVVKDAIPAPARRTGGHPARRTFQALRIEVNRELPNLAEGLDESVQLVEPGGRIAVISYHSLEDRIVKRRFRAWAATHLPPVSRDLPARAVRPLVRLLGRRSHRPDTAEVAANPRARSARLRAVERLP
ncbi:MAG: 16S rRNA (cytosine(1402)-N(4))-methyltransferase RsmH [Candidatus Rokuibacteriota bacterium]